MSSVFLSNVDDYLGPSQACVNPLFSTDKEETQPAAPAATEEQAPPAAGKVIPRRRRRANGGSSSRNSNSNSRNSSGDGPRIPVKPDIVKATIADCLACSGCVTTAETVLLEEKHSLKVLNSLMDQPNHPEIVVTISPASWADLLRHYYFSLNHNHHPTTPQASASASASAHKDIRLIERHQRQLTTLLQQTLSASVVLDGTVPLEWSRHAAAREFCRVWRAAQHEHKAMDNSRMEEEEEEEDGAAASGLPVVSSSCPATVCLVEKSLHRAVPHLAVTKSPMSMAGAFWKKYYHNNSSNNNNNNNNNMANTAITGTRTSASNKNYFHLAIMPCHDKKLEASRPEFAHGQEDPDVNMVITTQECLELMQQRWQEKTATPMWNWNDVPIAPVYRGMEEWKQNPSTGGVLIVSEHAATTTMAPRSDDDAAIWVESSGAYADYIFRYAAQELFGVAPTTAAAAAAVQPIWTRVVDPSGTQKVSARVAAQRKREFYQAALYAPQQPGGEYSTSPPTPDSTPVLCFGIAYGMQTMQRALQPFQDKGITMTTTTTSSPFDYLEAMACPSGCINGGGQIRVAARETPTETRQRVSQSRQWFVTSSCSSGVEETTVVDDAHTHYRAIAPLQHSLGAAAGVAVQDTQW